MLKQKKFYPEVTVQTDQGSREGVLLDYSSAGYAIVNLDLMLGHIVKPNRVFSPELVQRTGRYKVVFV